MSQEVRLRQLFERYLAGQCTAGEIEELVMLMQKEEAETTLSPRMFELWQKTKNKQKVYDVDWQGMYDRVLSQKGVNQKERKRPFNYILLRVAAAVIALVAISVGIYLGYNEISNRQVPAEQAHKSQQDVLPGGNKAVLTLGNGRVINLNAAASGAVANQGGMQVIKLDSGQLAYRAADRSASPDEVEYNTLATPRGGQYQLILPDGSKVWLNAASSIRFPTAFMGKKREVEISGEVYFEIAENARMPFIVKKGDMKVQVLGTHFNVKAYDDEVKTKVTLLEGKVKVTSGNGGSAVLKHGQQAILQRFQNGSGQPTTQKISVKEEVDLEEIMAWKEGLFVFRNDDLISIMQRLQRWYDIHLEYESNDASASHFTGTISRDADLSKVLKMLELTGGVHFEIKDKTIIIKS